MNADNILYAKLRDPKKHNEVVDDFTNLLGVTPTVMPLYGRDGSWINCHVWLINTQVQIFLSIDGDKLVRFGSSRSDDSVMDSLHDYLNSIVIIP